MSVDAAVWYKSWPCIPREAGEKRRKVFRASFEHDKKDPPISLLLAMEYARIWHKENVQRLEDHGKFKKKSDEMKKKRAGAWREYVKKRLKVIQLKQKSKEAELRRKNTNKIGPNRRSKSKTQQSLKENKSKSEREKNAPPISKIEESKNMKTDVNASKEVKKTDVTEGKEVKNNVCTCPVPKPVIPLRCNNCGVIVTTNSSDPKNPGYNSKNQECVCENCHRPILNLAKQ